MKKKFITKEDRAALSAAKKVLKKIAGRCAKLEKVRRKADSVPPAERDSENGKKWKAASLELYNLLDEIEAARLDVRYEAEGEIQNSRITVGARSVVRVA